MQTNAERVAAVKRRAAHRERLKRLRGNRIAALSAVVSCLAVIVGVSFAMPGLAEKLTAADYAGFEAAASIFSGSAAAGYIVVGLLAFALGVGAAVLCFRLRAFRQKDEETGEGDGRIP